MNHIITKKNVGYLALFGAVIFGFIFFFGKRNQNVAADILDFEYGRDAGQILQLFEKDRYWLTATPGYSAERMLKTKSPNEWDDRYQGALNIKVVRQEGKFAGFFAYYKKNSLEGFVLFVAVDHAMRSQGFGALMLNYAVQALFDDGAQVVRLVTRTSNHSAIRLYNRLGLTETSRDDGYVYFAKWNPQYKSVAH